MSGKSHDDEPIGVLPAERAFGRYRLCFEIASGGMATVFLARAADTAGVSRLVALKRIHPHLARQREFVDMFVDEARIASRITHPNVCGVIELGEETANRRGQRTYFLAMEYLEGEPLSAVLRALSRADVPPLRRAAVVSWIVAQACEGLHAAHELRGDDGRPLEVVHRDVSPQNLFVTYGGAVKVVDFGIARARNRLVRTETGTLRGKLGYMAPEQLEAPRAIDRRVDVWALGVVSHEALTLKRLFRRESELETVFAIAHDEIPPPSRLVPGLPPLFDEVLSRALARDPARRTLTARALGRELLEASAALGRHVGAADVAELMETLFAEGIARKRALAERALRLDDEAAPPPSRPSVPTAPTIAERPAVRPSSEGAASSASRVAAPAAPPNRARSALVAASFAVVGATGFVAIALTPARDPAPAAPPSPELAAPRPATDAAPPSLEAAPEAPDEGAPTPVLALALGTTPASDAGAPASAARTARSRARRDVGTSPGPPPPTVPPAERSPPPPSLGTGTVAIVARGASGVPSVFESDRQLGFLPAQLRLPAGRHVLEVRTSSGDVRRISVDVAADATTRAVVDFAQPP